MLAAIIGAQIGSAFTPQGVPLLYPFIQSELGLSRTEVGFIASALAAGGTISSFPGGWFADIVGVKRVMVITLVTMAVFLGVFSLSRSFLLVLALFMLLGAAHGPIYPTTSRGIMEWAPPRRLALAMSVKQTGVPVAGAIAGLILPAIALWGGWRAAAFTIGGITLVTGILFLIFYQNAPHEEHATQRMSLSTLAIFGKNRCLLIASIWSVVFVGLQQVVLCYFVLFLVKELNFSPILAGGVMATAQASSIIARVGWGGVSDLLFKGRRVAILALVGFLAAGGLLATSLITPSTAQIVVGGIGILVGITTLSWHGVFTTFIGEMAGREHTGIVVGVVTTLMHVAQMVVPPLFGLLADTTNSYELGWRLMAILAVVMTIVLLVCGREPKR